MNDDADWFLDKEYAEKHNLDIGPWSDIIIG